MNQVLSYRWTFVLLLSQGLSAYVVAQSALGLQHSSSLFSNDGVRPYSESQFFQEQYLRDSTYIFSLSDDGAAAELPEWEVAERSIYEYNNNGQVTTRILSSWDEQVWTPSILHTYSYNERSELVNTLKSVWNVPLQKWEQWERNRFFYNFFGAEYESRTYQWQDGSWVPISRELKTYDHEQNLTSEVIYNWNLLSDDWKPTMRMLFTYDEDNQMSEETVQTWNPETAKWENQRTSNFVYNGDNHLVETLGSIWNKGLEMFTPEVITLLDYNDQGMPEATESIALGESGQEGLTLMNAEYNDQGVLDQVFTNHWDETSDSWEPYRYEEHYWSRYLTGNINATTGDIACQFVNPYEMGMPWYCNSLKEDLQYDVLVYDLLGRLYFQTQFQGGHSFNIRGAIPPGLYMVVIQGGLDVHTEKVLFR